MSILTSRSTLSISPQPLTSVRSCRAPGQSHGSGSLANVFECSYLTGVTANDSKVTTKLTSFLPTRAEKRSCNSTSCKG